MALQVWLPFNGDPKNYGVSQAKYKNASGASYEQDGILGTCLKVGTSTGVTCVQQTPFVTSKFTIALWIKINSSAPYVLWNDIFALTVSNSAATSSGTLRLEINGTSTFTIFGNGIATNDGGLCSYSTVQDTWNHYVYTFDGLTCRLYVNGVLTVNQNYTNYANFKTVTLPKYFLEYGSKASICDFRFYDTCLSDDRIRDLAKGLVLHFPMTQAFNKPNVNLLGDWYNAKLSGGMALSGGIKSITDGRKCLVTIRSVSEEVQSTISSEIIKVTNAQATSLKAKRMLAASRPRRMPEPTEPANINIDCIDVSKLKPNTSYVFKMKILSTCYSNIAINIFPSATTYSSYGDTDFTNCAFQYKFELKMNQNVWYDCTYVITTPSTLPSSSYKQYICVCIDGYYSIGLYIADLSLREGSNIKNLYLPYSDSAINGTVEYDCSGFKNNGRTPSESKPKSVCIGDSYNSCYEFRNTNTVGENNTSKSNIIRVDNFYIPDEFTISFWVYDYHTLNINANNIASYFQCGNTSSSSYSNYGFCSYDNIVRLALSKFGEDTVATTLAVKTYADQNTWVHFVLTFDGYNFICYKNGVKYSSASSGLSYKTHIVRKYNTLYIGGSTAGGTYRFLDGMMSDFRIYGTALSADMVKSLYDSKSY